MARKYLGSSQVQNVLHHCLLQNGYMTFPWNVISMYFLSFEELTEFSISNGLDWVECRFHLDQLTIVRPSDPTYIAC